MEAMIVDLESIHRTNPLLNVGHTPCHLHRNHSQITPCKERRVALTLAHFCYTPKNETVTWDFTYAFSLSVHLSSLQVARGCDVPLNSHYECRSNLHQMGSQMKSQLNLSLNFEPSGATN